MRKIYIMLLMSSVVLLTACDMLDIQPTGKVIPQTLAEYRALIATAYKNVPDARGLACFRSDELYVKDDSWDDKEECFNPGFKRTLHHVTGSTFCSGGELV